MATMTYGEQLKHPNWQRKRLEVLQRSDFKCERCFGGDTTLHVHHKRYVKGRMAWEYGADELSALCEACHEHTHEEGALFSSLLARFDPDGPRSISAIHGMAAGWAWEWAHGAPEPSLFAEMDPHSFTLGLMARRIWQLPIPPFDGAFRARLCDSFRDPVFLEGLVALVEASYARATQEP